MSECMYCKGRLTEQKITHPQFYDGHWYIIENLPALVCEQCGEIYLTPKTHDLIVAFVTGEQSPSRTEQVAVYDAAG